MADAIRTVTFKANASGITPNVPQFAGIEGEHKATRIVFELDPVLVNTSYKYRIEFSDGNGGFDTTEFIQASENTVSTLVPNLWTHAGGTGEARLSAVILDDEQNEEQVVYTVKGRLYFQNGMDGDPISVPDEGGLSGLVERANESIDAANSAAADAAASAVTADGAAGRANAAAQSAEEIAQEVQGKLDRGELTGPKGDPGAPGAAATVAVGTVTTGAAGSGAAVTNAGTASAAVFNFTIPRGDKGDTGLTGPQGLQGPKGDTGPEGPQGPKGDTGEGLTVLGRYDTPEALQSAVPTPSAGANYYVGTAAPYDVYTYTQTDGWLNVGPLQGAKGDTGPAGPQGEPGAPGTAATVAVGTVTTGAAGSGAAVTNAGTASAAVFNFTIPRGDKGETGAAGAQGAPGPNEVSESTATALSGLLKGDGTKVTTAAAGTDYATPEQLDGKQDYISARGILKGDGQGGILTASSESDYATPGYVNGQISVHNSSAGSHINQFNAKLDKSGGTMTGTLNMSGGFTAKGVITLPFSDGLLKTTLSGIMVQASAGTDYTPGTPTSTTIKLTFSNGDTVNLKAYKFGRLVMFPESVWVDKGNVTEGKVGTIPTGYRPTANFTLCPPSNLGYGGYIQFRTNGDIYIGQLMGGVRFAGFICNINYVVP